jgi:2-polyprenyl-6-methoxyphenol hydroxylase-like FAD-dependent oxidoreductase
MRQQAEKYSSVEMLCGWRANSFEMDDDGVNVSVTSTESEEKLEIQAAYMVGCDGPRSFVRKSCGIVYEGHTDGDRDFFGGQMLSVFFTSKNLYALLNKKKAWMYWAVNSVQRGMLVSIDGVDKFLFALQLKPGQTAESVDFRAAAFSAVGAEFDLDLIGVAPWFAGFTLVAEKFGKDRVFIAGDAAHLFTPTGGMGYNTSVDDAVNLGWKLAGVIQGWADKKLLATYESERKPIAHRNTTFARAMADNIGKIKVPTAAEEKGAQGDLARAELGAALNNHVRTEFNIPGLQLGLRYDDSPIVAAENSAIPDDKPNTYIPSAKPGGRAPHFWIDGKSIFDTFGLDFTLLCLGKGDQSDVALWEKQFAAHGVPLHTTYCDLDEASALYETDRVLIRPDHHVAWRGANDSTIEEIQKVIKMVCAKS